MENKQLKQIIDECVSGNSKAQELLYHYFSPLLFGVCLRYADHKTEAEDILQDAFIRIFEKLHLFHFSGSFEGWLRRIVINVALDKIRKQKHKEQHYDMEQVENTAPDNNTAIPMDILLQMIQELPEKYRIVFNLYVLDNYKHAEIADLLQISEGTSKSNLARARQLLQQKVNNFINKNASVVDF